MFEVINYAGKDIECPHCEKISECVNVKCKANTFEGPMCGKCILRTARIRSAGQKKPQPPTQPQPNGQPAPASAQPVTPKPVGPAA